MFLCCCFWQVHQCGALFRRRPVYPLLYVYFHSHSLLCWNDIKLLTFFVPQACSLGQCWLPLLSSAIPTGPEPYSEQFPEPWGFWHPTMRVMTPSLLHTACTPRNMSSLKRCVFSVPKEYVKSEEVCILCTQGICQVWRGVYSLYPKEYVKSEEVCMLCTPRNMSSLKRCVFSALPVHQGIWHTCTTFHTVSTFVWGPLCCWTPCVRNLQWNISLLQDQLGTSHLSLTRPAWDLTSLSYKTSLGPHISLWQDQLGTSHLSLTRPTWDLTSLSDKTSLGPHISLWQDQLGTSHLSLTRPAWDLTSVSYKTSLGPHISLLQDQLGTSHLSLTRPTWDLTSLSYKTNLGPLYRWCSWQVLGIYNSILCVCRAIAFSCSITM